MPSKLEQLPLELLLIIFSHLEAHDLVNAFGNLNSYFRSVLASPQLRVHVNIDANDLYGYEPSPSNSGRPRIFMNGGDSAGMMTILVRKRVLNFVRGSIGSFLGIFGWKKSKKSLGIEAIAPPLNPPLLSNSIWSFLTLQSICSLKTQDRTNNVLVQFVQCHAPRLVHLTSLTLRIEKDHVEDIVNALPHLVSLRRLSIKQVSRNNDETSKHSLLSAILGMKSLRACIMDGVSLMNTEENLSISNSIEKLLTNGVVSTSFILFVLHYMPNLRVFQLQSLTWREFSSFSDHILVHNHLAVIRIGRWNSTYVNLERLIRAAPSLRCLHISYWGMSDEEIDILFDQNSFKRLVEHIAHVHIDFALYVYPHEKSEAIHTWLKTCSWLTLTKSFYDYLDAETVFNIVFKQLKRADSCSQWECGTLYDGTYENLS